MNPFQVVRDFEAELCRYTGAPYAVTATSCTMALLLAVAWQNRLNLNDWRRPNGARWNVSIPKRTYVSVPMAVIHAGCYPIFRDEEWNGAYQLKPLPVWDSARYFTSGLWPIYRGFVCVSFHASKTLGDSQGGAILHDNPEADAWFREARFDGRIEGMTPANQAAVRGAFRLIGWHCYMSPDVAARLLHKLSVLPKHNAPLPNDDYPDLSQMEIFK